MTRIERIELREIHMALRSAFRSAAGAVHTRRVVLIEVVGDDGQTGWGESVALAGSVYSAETQDTVWAKITSELGPAVLGRPFHSPAALARALVNVDSGSPMARAAVEMAAWDLAAKGAGVSLAELLGGSRRAVQVGIVIGLQPSTNGLEAVVENALTAGYSRIKLKISPFNDLEPVALTRRVAGTDMDVAVDGNGSYSLDDVGLLQRLDAFGLSMIEQPLAANDLPASAELQRSLATPICLDEPILDVRDVAEALRLDAGRIVNVKPGRVGGHASALAIHELSANSMLPIWCGGMLESGVGRAHCVALASLSGFTLPADIGPSERYWNRDLVDPPWMMSGGMLTVPWDQPGIGTHVDREFIEATAVRTVSLTPGI